MKNLPSFCCLSLLAGLLIIVGPVRAEESDAGLKKPTPLWNSQPKPESEEDYVDYDEPVKKKKVGKEKEPLGTQQTAKEMPKETQKPPRDVSVDKDFAKDTASIAAACPRDWESEPCLKATSQAAMVLISQYGASLQQGGYEDAMEPLKQECAASTAATQQDGIPAYAMKSAYTVCANKIGEIAESTGVKPDPSYFQLIFATIICMDKQPQCERMEESIVNFGK